MHVLIGSDIKKYKTSSNFIVVLEWFNNIITLLSSRLAVYNLSTGSYIHH